MDRLRRASALRLWIVALYALATVTLGLSHHAGAVPTPADPELVAYALPDGTLPLLCLDGTGNEDGGSTAGSSRICDACLLTAAPGLPTAAAPEVAWTPPAAGCPVAAVHEAAPRSFADAFERSRAPPVTPA